MTPLTPESLALVRELRGVVDVVARLRFCARLLAETDHPTSLEVRVQVVRTVLVLLAAELGAAQIRIESPPIARVLEKLGEITSLAAEGRPFVRGGRLARIVQLSREAKRVLRSA